jgi:hypothetical protein
MLYELLDEKNVQADDFDLAAYKAVYTGLTHYPGGDEIARSFEIMSACLACDDVAALPQAVNLARIPRQDSFIRPAVIEALARLGQVSAEAAAYQDATSRANQLAALARAGDLLKQLEDDVTRVVAPEQYILQRIIRQWQQLITEAGGQVGRAEAAGPVTNPFLVGNPVTGDLFIGRQDILRRLEELWAKEGQCPSVVLYGHRRMGKSSILHNLGAHFGANTVVVDFNMQRVGLVGSTGELLHNMATALSDAQTFEVSETSKVLPVEEQCAAWAALYHRRGRI